MKKKEKIIISTIVGVIVLIALVVGGLLLIKYVSIKASADEFMTKIETGDMSAFNLPQSNEKNNVMKNKIEEWGLDPKDFGLEDSEPELSSGDKLIQTILQYSDVEYSISVFKNKVTYTINAPDMEIFMKNLNPNEFSTTDDLFEQNVDYIKTTQNRKAREVEVTYQKQDGKWVPDYSDYVSKEFLDAFTGGMGSGYQYWYNQMLQEFRENLGV